MSFADGSPFALALLRRVAASSATTGALVIWTRATLAQLAVDGYLDGTADEGWTVSEKGRELLRGHVQQRP